MGRFVNAGNLGSGDIEGAGVHSVEPDSSSCDYAMVASLPSRILLD